MIQISSKIYTVDDYSNIVIDGFEYSLSDHVKTIIQNLNSEMDLLSIDNANIQNGNIQGNFTKNPVKTKRPYYSNSHSNSNSHSGNANTNKNQRLKPSGGSNNRLDEDWQNAKPVFKATTIEKKEGVEKQINDIRICLNKISNKNYQSQCDSIIEMLRNITNNIDVDVDEENDQTNNTFVTVANALFDIASNNKFYSEIYADLTVELTKHFSIFSEMLDGFMDKYRESLHDIKVVDSTENYDLHCTYNKINDKRKAMTTFIVNLMKKEMITYELVGELLFSMLHTVYGYLDEEKRTSEVEEITENVFIMITMSYTVFKNKAGEQWSKIEEKIREISQMKPKERKSLSSRSLFRYKDMVDFLNKNNL